MDDELRNPSVGSEKAGYLFEFRKDGVYLTVYPNYGDEILFELSDMRQILKDYKVFDYDIELLARVVRESSGFPTKLSSIFTVPENWEHLSNDYNVIVEESAEPLESEETEEDDDKKDKVYGTVVVTLSRDMMKAKVRFECSVGQLKPTEDMVFQALQDKGVIFGIDREAISKGVKSGFEFVAAVGKPPENGQDAVIDRKFNMGIKGRPVEDEHGRVNYKNMNLFVMTKKGDVLAERIPQTRGVPGMNILGNSVKAKNGKPKPVPNGKNTVVVDENTVVADIDGQIIDNGNKINVDPHLKINGDVGVGTGDIDFNGGVSISGNVQAGFVVKATGDIEINGFVSGANVRGRNIVVKGGIQGMNRAVIVAQEDIQVNFVENAEVEAGGNISIADVVLNSEIRAGKQLIVAGKHGLITGGSLAAGELIEAVSVGNTANVATRLSVGVNPMLQKKYKEVLKEYNESRSKLAQLTKALNTLGKLDISKLPKERVEQINALTRSQFPLAGKVQRNEQLLNELDEEMQKMKNGKIRVKEKLYPGVKLSINSILKNVQSEEQHCTLYVEDDFIRTGPY